MKRLQCKCVVRPIRGLIPLIAVFAPFFILPITGCSDRTGSASETPLTSAQQPLTAALLTTSTKTIDLGIVPQAGSEQETFSLANPGTTAVEISTVQTSCACLELSLARRTVAPGENVLVRARLDLGKEPRFLGNLAIEVKGNTPTGETAFSIVTEVSVRPAPEFGANGD